MSKKLLFVVLALCFCLSAVACGEAEKPDRAPANTDNTPNIEQSEKDNTKPEEPENTNSKTEEQESKNEEPETTQAVDVHSHFYAPATCTEPQACECGETYGDPLGHDLSEATCTDRPTCSRCGISEGDALGHDYGDATCTEAAKCSRCGEAKGEALGHDLSEATCTDVPVCSRCNETVGEPLGHDFVDGTCTRCAAPDPDVAPVPLSDLHVIDSGYYKYKNEEVIDSFGNEYSVHHNYVVGNLSINPAAYSIHNLRGEYKTFKGSIAAWCDVSSEMEVDITIYLDDKVVFEIEKLKKTTEKIDFSIDVTGGTQLKIYIHPSYNYDVLLVDAFVIK